MASAIWCLLVACWCAALVARAADNSSLSRGFGDHINWVTMKDGIAAARQSGKPTMVLIHKTWCGACKALKPQFQDTSSDIGKLSKHFSMVNLEDDEEPVDEQFSPDGKYIPRIFFLNSEGVVDKDIQNVQGNPNYLYFYSDARSVAESMKEALRKMPPTGFDPHAEL